MLSRGAVLVLPSSRSPRTFGLALLFAALAAAYLAPLAAGQQYKTDKVDDRLRLKNLAVQGYMRNPSNDPADKQLFDAFFTQYYFPAMTRTEPENLADLGSLRQELFTRFLWVTPSEQLQKDLTEKAFKAMGPIVIESAYHPAVRFNAILVIGQLDEQYAIEAGPDRRPPKPLPNANKALDSIVDAAADGKPVPPQLLVGALIGLERHARFHEALPPDAVVAMSAVVLKLLDREEPLPNTDSDVAAWIKLKAVAVLAELGSVGGENKAHLALMRMVGDDNLSLDNRCQAADLLRKLNYDGVKLDAKTTVDPLMQLAVDVADSEGKRAAKFQNRMIDGGGSSRSRGPRGSVRGEDEKYDRRSLLSKLIDLRRGLGAVQGAVPAEEQQQIEAVLAEIRIVVTSASDKDTVDLKLVAEVQEMAGRIRDLAQTGEAEPDDGVAEGAL